MNKDDIIKLLGDDWVEVRGIIREALRSDVDLLNRTNNTILENSGKMLRPMITLLIAGAVSAINEDSRYIAAFTEILHNATLMHDDVTDESRTRRGRPSVMSMIGSTAAVLVGDFWLARSMETLSKASCAERLMGPFSSTITDLAEGEMLQMEKSMSLDMEEEDYFRVIYCKTASLFHSACKAAALAAGADEIQYAAVGEYGRALGIAFQIKDDILDYEGDSSMGKPSGVDVREQKITLPLIGAFKNAPERREEIVDMLCNVREHPEYCILIRDFVVENGGLGYAVDSLDAYVGRALRSLEPLRESPYRDALSSLARYNSIRQK